jgi:hypothetical protein
VIASLCHGSQCLPIESLSLSPRFRSFHQLALFFQSTRYLQRICSFDQCGHSEDGNYDERTGGKMELQALKLFLMSKYGVERVDTLFWEVTERERQTVF